MKYNDINKSSIVGVVLLDNPNGEIRYCFMCGSPTDWFDLDFSCPICSEECSLALWTDFQEASLQCEILDEMEDNESTSS